MTKLKTGEKCEVAKKECRSSLKYRIVTFSRFHFCSQVKIHRLGEKLARPFLLPFLLLHRSLCKILRDAFLAKDILHINITRTFWKNVQSKPFLVDVRKILSGFMIIWLAVTFLHRPQAFSVTPLWCHFLASGFLSISLSLQHSYSSPGNAWSWHVDYRLRLPYFQAAAFLSVLHNRNTWGLHQTLLAILYRPQRCSGETRPSGDLGAD